MLGAIDRVAEQLNNTRAVCRKYYIHPAVLESYLEGTLVEELSPSSRNGKRATRLSTMETSVLSLIRHHNGNGAAPAGSRPR